MSGYGDEDRYCCDSDGSCGSEGGAHNINDAFLERSDRESREEGCVSSQHLSMSRYNNEDADFASARWVRNGWVQLSAAVAFVVGFPRSIALRIMVLVSLAVVVFSPDGWINCLQR